MTLHRHNILVDKEDAHFIQWSLLSYNSLKLYLIGTLQSHQRTPHTDTRSSFLTLTIL